MQGVTVALIGRVTKAQFDSTMGIHPSIAEEFMAMWPETRRISAGIKTAITLFSGACDPRGSSYVSCIAWSLCFKLWDPEGSCVHQLQDPPIILNGPTTVPSAVEEVNKLIIGCWQNCVQTCCRPKTEWRLKLTNTTEVCSIRLEIGSILNYSCTAFVLWLHNLMKSWGCGFMFIPDFGDGGPGDLLDANCLWIFTSIQFFMSNLRRKPSLLNPTSAATPYVDRWIGVSSWTSCCGCYPKES